MKTRRKILAFVCNWCSYAGADQAGGQHLGYPPSVRLVRVMCSGRVEPAMILEAFRSGADGVMVLGCHPGDCHYREGNYNAQRRVALMRGLLDGFGVEQERLRLDWVSATEGRRFARLAKEMDEVIERLGPLTLPDPRAPEVSP